MGLPPQTLLGDIVPKPLLRFAAALSSLAGMYRVAIHEGDIPEGNSPATLSSLRAVSTKYQG
jgi:hypothetical protein